jgi:chromosome segregation ATPase
MSTVTNAVPISAGEKLEGLVAEEAAQQAAAASEVSHLKAQLSQTEAIAAAAEQQADSLSTQLAEAQQALIDADRHVYSAAPDSHAR